MKSLHHVIVLLFVAVVSFSGTGKAVHAVQSDAEQAPATQDSPETTPPTDQTESEPFSATKFLRLHTDEYANPEALQTATAKYVLHDDKGNVKLEVFLESFVHIADSSYFRSFQKRFDCR